MNVINSIAKKLNRDVAQVWLLIIKETTFVYGSVEARLELLGEHFEDQMLTLKDRLWSNNKPDDFKLLGNLTSTIK